MLLRRNNEWLNGTIPGFCLAFAGSNTDVQPNDLLPILAETHEDHICKRNCVGKRSSVAKMSRRMTLSQSTRNGYFGGYMSKRQKVGHFESNKCIDKMHTLRARTAGPSEAKRRRAVSGRMVTDIEMNGTMRGAVEVFNLASRLRHGDALFAECVRTFPTRDLDARAWLHRLSVEAQRVQVQRNPEGKPIVTYITHVPATSRPHVRTGRAKAQYPQCYGYRPQRAPRQLLCAYEFMMY